MEENGYKRREEERMGRKRGEKREFEIETSYACTRIFTTSRCMPSHLFDIDVFLCTSFVQLDANLVCKLVSVFCLDYFLLWTVILVSH